MTAVYLDSSAIVKLVIEERESAGLISVLRRRRRRVSCGLARVEVPRSVRPHGADAFARSLDVLRGLDIVRLDDDLLTLAARLEPAPLRSLDAIHLAAALSMGPDLSVVITYDRRMAEAAERLGLRVSAPD